MKYKIFILCMFIFLLTGCVNENNLESKLKGIWKYNDIYINFNGDGTAYYTEYIDANPRKLTILSKSGIMIEDIVFTVEFKNGNVLLNDYEFVKVSKSDDFDNYLTSNSSYENFVDEIEYKNISNILPQIGYLNYINEYYKITNIPVAETNFVSENETIDLICKIVNKYDDRMQMNEANCILSN